ncbi:sensor histidine kinase [Adhaeribacter aquaticus]|uniref:sensor histidine kinase n=1 Tax=Adhaeribacter aquaticus TaxID=299567 RepID=UPI00146FAC3C|nr:sensor histidine kinase [Adhaeribacter aquaticus]
MEHTNQVLLKLENILSLLKDAETGQRGFLLTNDEEFLEPYIGSYYNTIQSYKAIRNLTIDNPSQQQKLDTLITLVEKRFSILNRTIEFEKAGNVQQAHFVVSSKEGKRVMDQIRRVIKRMQAEELRLKEIRYDQVRTSSFVTPITMVVATLLSLIVAIFAYRKTKEAMHKARHLNHELATSNSELLMVKESLFTLNQELEKKVDERTQNLEKAKVDLNHLNQELIKKNNKLVRTNTDLDNFIYTASHDLKAPIANIEGLTYALKDSNCYQEEEPKILIQMLENASLTLREVIEDLALVSGIEEEGSFSDTEIISIEEITTEIQQTIAPLFEETKAEIILDLNETGHIYFSRNNFQIILFNLIQNAIKYRSPQRAPRIYIRTKKLPDFTVLSVQDNGIGFDPATTDKIFGLFKKMHNLAEGTGIGLYIVKRIMDRVNGQIQVDSQPGKGATFHLFFPEQR